MLGIPDPQETIRLDTNDRAIERMICSNKLNMKGKQCNAREPRGNEHPCTLQDSDINWDIAKSAIWTAKICHNEQTLRLI